MKVSEMNLLQVTAFIEAKEARGTKVPANALKHKEELEKKAAHVAEAIASESPEDQARLQQERNKDTGHTTVKHDGTGVDPKLLQEALDAAATACGAAAIYRKAQDHATSFTGEMIQLALDCKTLETWTGVIASAEYKVRHNVDNLAVKMGASTGKGTKGKSAEYVMPGSWRNAKSILTAAIDGKLPELFKEEKPSFTAIKKAVKARADKEAESAKRSNKIKNVDRAWSAIADLEGRLETIINNIDEGDKASELSLECLQVFVECLENASDEYIERVTEAHGSETNGEAEEPRPDPWADAPNAGEQPEEEEQRAA